MTHLASKKNFLLAFYVHACLEELYLKLQSNGLYVRVQTSRWSMLSKHTAMSRLGFWPLGPGETQKGLQKVVTGFPRVSSETLLRLYQGEQSMSQFNGTKKQLTDLEEQIIVDFALQSADRGFPPTHRFLECQVNAILESRLGPDYVPVGHNWMDQFVLRHCDKLQGLE